MGLRCQVLEALDRALETDEKGKKLNAAVDAAREAGVSAPRRAAAERKLGELRLKSAGGSCGVRNSLCVLLFSLTALVFVY